MFIRATLVQLKFIQRNSETGPNFGLTIRFSTMTILQLKRRCQEVSGPKEHPSCSPDLTPNDFWLFPKIKCALKGRRFQAIEDITYQNRYDGTENYSTTGVPNFQQRQHCWAKCIAAQGEYFEGDPSQ
jgi:hypothetical protein